MSKDEKADRVERGFDPVGKLFTVLGVAAGLMVAAMMFITFVDVIGRYVFNSPLFGAFEVTEILMGLVIFAGLPLATAARENVTISILGENLPERWQQWQARIFEAVCALVCFVIAWRMWLYGERLWRTGDETLELQVSLGLLSQVMAVLLVVAGLAFAINAFRGRQALPNIPASVE